jgi:hypothetical protein
VPSWAWFYLGVAEIDWSVSVSRCAWPGEGPLVGLFQGLVQDCPIEIAGDQAGANALKEN